jgi:transposase
MAIVLPDARQLSDDLLEALRLRALRGRELGFTEAGIADLFGVSRETVCRWWSEYRAAGDVPPQRHRGRPLGVGRLLSESQAQAIQDLLDHYTPEQLGLAAPLWNRRAVRDLIERKCGLRLAVRTVGLYLRRWGYTVKRPRRHARHQDPEEVRQWLEETYPAIEHRAAQEKATIFWGDELGVAADAHPGRGYARVGQPATVEVPEPHIRVNQMAAVSNRGQVRFMTYTGTMTALLFLVFLRRLLRSTIGKIFLIVDRLKAHEDARVAAWLARHRDRIEVFYLPRRAPERNPEEYLNNDLKGQVDAEGLPDSKEALRERMLRFMRRLVHLPEHVMSYFQHPCAQYAAGLTDTM